MMVNERGTVLAFGSATGLALFRGASIWGRHVWGATFTSGCGTLRRGGSVLGRPMPPSQTVLHGSRMSATAASTAGAGEDSFKSPMFDVEKSFTDIGASPDTAEHLKALGIQRPTHVQSEVVPMLREGLDVLVEYGRQCRKAEQAGNASERDTWDAGSGAEMEVFGDETAGPFQEPGATQSVPDDVTRPDPPVGDHNDVVMMGAETGSGKTLSYLLPYFETVRKHSDYGLKAVVLVPSRELCSQVERQLKEYFPECPPHLVLAGGSLPDVTDISRVRVLIATPASLLQYFRFSPKIDANDKLIVIDEADMLLTGSYVKQIERILDQPGMKPFAVRKNRYARAVNRNRLVFVGATYPQWTGERVRSVVNWIRKRYPTAVTVRTDEIHKRSTAIEESWHYVGSDEERFSELRRVLDNEVSAGEKVMVFCGESDAVQRLADQLEESYGPELRERFGGISVLHKNIRSSYREESLADFRTDSARLLLCTDLAARGLDLGKVTRVIEYDFSTNVVGYLHRIGRTARAGASGRTHHFYDEVTKPLATAIQTRSEANTPVVDGVFSRRRGFRKKMRRAMKESDIADNQSTLVPS